MNKFILFNYQNSNFHLIKRIFLYIKEHLLKIVIPKQKQQTQRQKKQKQRQNKQSILSYLIHHTLIGWYKYGQLQQKQNQCEQCLAQYIILCNQYVQVANRSRYFIEVFLEQVQIEETINNNIIYSPDKFFDELPKWKSSKINNAITFKDNFSVCLGNFFYDKIQILIKTLQPEDQNQETSILAVLFQQFQNAIVSSKASNIQELIKIQFCKNYLKEYIKSNSQESFQRNNLEAVRKVDQLLQKNNNQISKHLKIYILKQLYHLCNKDISKLKSDFLEIETFGWINHKEFSEILTKVSHNRFLLLPNLQQTKDIKNQITLFRQSNYQINSHFHQILLMGFKQPQNMYEVLNFLMLDVYTQLMPTNKRNLYLKQFENRNDVKQLNNQIQVTLIRKYFKSHVTDVLFYDQNLPFQKFKINQMPMLMAINSVVSLRKVKSPNMEMFFDDQGKVPINFSEWIQQRYIIGGNKNSFSSKIQQHLESQQPQAPGYYRCSTACDYIYSVGGYYQKAYLGCKNLTQLTTCPFCKGLIGAKQHNTNIPFRANQGAKQIKYPDELNNQLETIRQKKEIMIYGKIQKMVGYTIGKSIEDLERSLNDSNIRMDPITARLMNFITFTLWYYLTQAELIKLQIMAQLLKVKAEDVIKTLLNACQWLSKQMMNAFSEEKYFDTDEALVWQFSLFKKIFQFTFEYPSKFSDKSKTKKLSLLKALDRNKFEKDLSQSLIQYYGGTQKEKIVLSERKVRTKTKQKIEIIKEIDDQNFRSHFQQYPLLRVFKHNQLEKTPSYQKMIEQYKPRLQKEHPILHFMVDAKELMHKAAQLKIIYVFISKLIKMANFKLARLDANTMSLQKYINQFFDNKTESAKEIHQFIQAWNRLAKDKINLQYRCHDASKLGELTQVTPDEKLITFLPDNKHKDNSKGQKVLALLQVTASEYNRLCSSLKIALEKSRKVGFSDSAFNLTEIYPTSATQNSKMIHYPNQTIIHQVVSQYSCFSVQYGISLPYYDLDEIESYIAKYFNGCKFLVEDVEKYNIVNFVGEMTHCIAEVRADTNQKPMQVQFRQLVTNYIVRTNISNKAAFFKIMKNIQGSLELIMVHYKSAKEKSGNIRQFIEENKIHGLNEFIKEDPFGSVPLCSIVDLYETIQISNFNDIQKLLDQSYKREPLQEKERIAFVELIKRMKEVQGYVEGLPNYYDFQVALYRFVSRKLLLMEASNDKILYDFIAMVEELWPMGTDIYSFSDKKFRLTLQVKLTKTGSILQMIPMPKIPQMRKDEQINHDYEKKENFADPVGKKQEYLNFPSRNQPKKGKHFRI